MESDVTEKLMELLVKANLNASLLEEIKGDLLCQPPTNPNYSDLIKTVYELEKTLFEKLGETPEQAPVETLMPLLGKAIKIIPNLDLINVNGSFFIAHHGNPSAINCRKCALNYDKPGEITCDDKRNYFGDCSDRSWSYLEEYKK